MSSRYDDAFVSTLKRIVWPLLTLMSVENPWIVELPAPATSHSLDGLPVLLFSHVMAFADGPVQGSGACAPMPRGRPAPVNSRQIPRAATAESRSQRLTDREIMLSAPEEMRDDED